ncbi:MAG: HAMP domain-containing protein [Deltaproteobacteria bacterium]|nr:HAMP domain-containing protein [Deltaproteobacteria bacterium]
MNIATRMSLSMGVIVVAVVVGAGGAYRQVRNMEYDGRVVNHTGIVRGATQRLVKLEMAGRPNDKLMEKLDRLVAALIQGDEELRIPPATDSAYREKMVAVQKAWKRLRRAVLKARSDPSLWGRVVDDSEKYFGLTNEAVFAAERFSRAKVTWFLVALSVVTLSILAAVGVVWRTLLTRVATPLRYVAERLRRVADRDVTVTLDLGSDDEIGEVAASANAMIETLRSLVVQASEASQELASISEELSATTNHIASSTEEISAQSREVAASAQEMSSTVQEVARNARAVDEATEEARRSATQGGEVIFETVAAMNEISRVVEHAASTVRSLGEETEKIGNVVQVIQEIATQTNLLALNAAIEAARAGEHGKGFGVVAAEVRELAGKTVKATQEIEATITRIQQESRKAVDAIDEGMSTVSRSKDLGEKAGRSVQEIESKVVDAAGQARQIAEATERLSATIRDMAVNMDEIAKGVAQTLGASSEVASTAETVASQAEEMQALTSRFRVA